MKMELLRMENLEKNTSLNEAINDKWSFVPLLVVFFFFFGYLFEDSICKNWSECCVNIKICP